MVEDGKLAYTQQVARWVVENLTQRDIVSIVAFNDRVTVLATAGRVVNKPFLFHRLAEILPAVYTDLSAGVLEGIAQVESQSEDGQVQEMLLFMDGLANRGVTGFSRLETDLRQGSGERDRGVHICTGTEFNERLLAHMAAAGAGTTRTSNLRSRFPSRSRMSWARLLQSSRRTSWWMWC